MSETPHYDKGIEFSPEGDLLQVQYAKEAVERGTAIIGIRTENSVILFALKSMSSTLVVPDSMEKIFQIDDSIVMATSGLMADSRNLIDYARENAQNDRAIYDEEIDVVKLAREMGSYMHTHTQYSGVRVFGASLLVAGIGKEKQPRLFAIDPSGSFLEYMAVAIGGGSGEIIKVLETTYKAKMKEKEAIILGIDVLIGTQKNPTLASMDIEGCVITTRGFEKISSDEMEEYIKKTIEKIKKEVGEK